MPNWCVGTLKLRGKKKDLEKFILEGLQPVNQWGEDLPKLKAAIKGKVFVCSSNEDCYIPYSYRGFIEKPDFELYGTKEEINTILVSARFADTIDADRLLKFCKEYHLDMNIFSFEGELQFNQIVEIIDGEIKTNECFTYDDYLWDCPCPTLGG